MFIVLCDYVKQNSIVQVINYVINVTFLKDRVGKIFLVATKPFVVSCMGCKVVGDSVIAAGYICSAAGFSSDIVFCMTL